MRTPRTLVDALEEAARADTGVWFVDGVAETFRSYAVLLQESRRIAAALLAAGLQRGDLVALMLPDPEQFLTALFGASIAGLVPASLYPPASLSELDPYLAQTSAILSTTAARGVVTPAALATALAQVTARCPNLAHVLTYESLAGAATPAFAPPALPPPPRLRRDSPNLADFLASEGGRRREDSAERPSLDDVAFVQFTSGSVSSPKGVAITHANLAANIDAINGPAGLATTDSDVAVSWLPLNHDMGLVGMALGALYVARPCVLMRPQVFVRRPVEWLRAIARHRGTVSFAPNFAFDLCVRRVKDLDGLDLSSWRVAGCGAEPIHAPTLLAFAEKFAPAGFRESALLPSYGLAEHVLAATFSPLRRPLHIDRVSRDDLLGRRVAAPTGDGHASIALVSCGRPFPGHELQIVDDDGRVLPERHVGEIVLRGPSVMRGYYMHEALTAETLRDGRLWTGDLGYLSEGELFVCGRAKDVIIVNGRKYHPQDLEWIVDDVGGVRRGRVVAFAVTEPGVPDCVVVVVEANGTVAEDALTASIRKQIADAFGVYVDEVVHVAGGTIGRTTSGKVQRAATKARYERGEFRATSANRS
jgi:fatty-acyl-CoA synthase